MIYENGDGSASWEKSFVFVILMKTRYITMSVSKDVWTPSFIRSGMYNTITVYDELDLLLLFAGCTIFFKKLFVFVNVHAATTVCENVRFKLQYRLDESVTICCIKRNDSTNGERNFQFQLTQFIRSIPAVCFLSFYNLPFPIYCLLRVSPQISSPAESRVFN